LLFAEKLVLHAWIFGPGSSSSHLIGFLVRATKLERKSALKRLRYYVSLKAVFPASERKYTAAGGDVQVRWGGIHE